MKNKLSSILNQKKSRGFTLVELLIVIAIIAILVLLVIVALDPLERIQDAQDRNAQNEARSLASVVAACITKELSKTSGTPFVAGQCDDEDSGGFLASNGYLQNAATVSNSNATTDGTSDICITRADTGGHGPVWWLFSTSTLTDPEVVTTEPAAFCP